MQTDMRDRDAEGDRPARSRLFGTGDEEEWNCFGALRQPARRR